MSEENTNKISTTEFMKACHDGDLNIVKLYVEQGGDIDVKTSNGNDGFSRAIYKGHIEVAKYLLENGADINAQSAKGKTPLHRAIIRAQWESIKFLIENGAEVNIQDECGDTPLHYAARFNYNKVAKLLIDYGARDNIINHKGKTASYEEKFPTLYLGDTDFAVYRNMWEKSTSFGQFTGRCFNLISNPLYSDELGSIEDMFKAKLAEKLSKSELYLDSAEIAQDIEESNKDQHLEKLTTTLKQFVEACDDAISHAVPGSQTHEELIRLKVAVEDVIKNTQEGNLDRVENIFRALVDAAEGKVYIIDSSSSGTEGTLSVADGPFEGKDLAGEAPSEDINSEPN